MTTIASNTPVTTFYPTPVSVSPKATTNTINNATSMPYDSVNLSSTAAPPLPTQAGTMKKVSNSIGEFFSNIADKLGFGETFKIGSQEFNQVDSNKDGNLNKTEFNVATLNLFDFGGTEFVKADQNRDGQVNVKEYVEYRKDQIGNAFSAKDSNGDSHLSINEMGWIGQHFLANHDPRLDENQDGLVNKREFIRSNLRGAISIRDFFGL